LIAIKASKAALELLIEKLLIEKPSNAIDINWYHSQNFSLDTA
jgi:hypothetical protein